MAFLAWFHALDLQLLYLINVAWSRPWLDPVMARVSDFDSWKIPLGIGAVLLLIFGRFRARQFLLLMLLCLAIGDGIIDSQIKAAVNRPRPMETEPHLRVLTIREVRESRPQHVLKGSSFTSGHTCNNVALAMVGCAVFGRWALLLWPWAALVSYSRIYCGSHYPSDILGSWIVAVAYSYLILAAAEWLWQRYAPTHLTSLYERHPRFLSWEVDSPLISK